MSAEGGGPVELLQHHLTLAADLCARCQNYSGVKGYNKLLKKCQAELKFLEGLRSRAPQDLKECHLRSSNLASLEGIVVAMETLPNVTSILQPFPWSHSPHPIVVDLVCNHGYTWVKVVARKAQALHLVWAGGGQFGERNVADQADELLVCAAAHPLHFQLPQVLLVFTGGVTAPLRDALTERGVHVQGQLVPVDDLTRRKLLLCADDDDDSDDGEVANSNDGDIKPPLAGKSGVEASRFSSTPEVPTSAKPEVTSPEPEAMSFEPEVTLTSSEMDQSGFTPSAGRIGSHAAGSAGMADGSLVDLLTSRPQVTRVNLDITALIALVSNQCHGGADFVFQEEVLSRQAAQERREALLPRLTAFMDGKEVFACETAVADFQTILGTVGGGQEKARAASLLSSRVCVVPDHPSVRAQRLEESAKVKDRAKVIFGTGDHLAAITVTANVGFVRAAKNQGITFAVYLHEPRALTEQKEATATPFTSSSREDSSAGSGSQGHSSAGSGSQGHSSAGNGSQGHSSAWSGSQGHSSAENGSQGHSSAGNGSQGHSSAGSSFVGNDRQIRNSAKESLAESSSEQLPKSTCSQPQSSLTLSS